MSQPNTDAGDGVGVAHSLGLSDLNDLSVPQPTVQHSVDYYDDEDDDQPRECVSCDGLAEVGDECWECHDSWRYIRIPRLT